MTQLQQTTLTVAGHGVSLCADHYRGESTRDDLVVFMHGGGQTRHAWAGAAQAVALAGFEVLNLDLRGHGDSDWAHDGCYQVETRSLDLQQVLSSWNKPVVLVGASMGGSTALYTALTKSLTSTLRKVILVDYVPHVASQGIGRIRRFMEAHLDGFDSVEEAAEAVAGYTGNRSRDKNLDSIQKNLRKGDDGRLRWHWDPTLLSVEASEETHTLVEAINQYEGDPLPSAVLIRGLHSDVVNDENTQRFLALYPSLQVLDVHGAGHMVAGDNNDAFIHTLLSTLHNTTPTTAPETTP